MVDPGEGLEVGRCLLHAVLGGRYRPDQAATVEVQVEEREEARLYPGGRGAVQQGRGRHQLDTVSEDLSRRCSKESGAAAGEAQVPVREVRVPGSGGRFCPAVRDRDDPRPIPDDLHARALRSTRRSAG